MGEAYLIGSRVTGEVVEIAAAGVKVALGNGRLGFVRRRELSWATDAQHERLQSIIVGDPITVLVLAEDDGYGRLALSLRQAEYDPWQEFEQAYHVGDVAHGVVVDIVEYGAFVEIVRGVQGLLHISHISPEWVTRVEDYLWIGDHVEALIAEIDLDKKHVKLSIKKRLSQLNRETTSELGRQRLVGEVMERLQTRERLANVTLEEEPAGPSRRILVVDDAHDVRESLSGWLERHGHHVTQAADGEAALACIEETHELVFMDVDLPGIDGIETTQRIRERFPRIPIVLITSVNWFHERKRELEQLNAIDTLLKPLDVDAVLSTVAELGERDGELPLEVEQELAFFKKLTTSSEASGSGAQLASMLNDVRVDVAAEAALVIEHVAHSQQYALVAQSSALTLEFDAIKFQLAYSPVRDVIESDAIVFENRAAFKHRRERFKHLLPLIVQGEFNGCIGVPLKTFGHVTRALFVLHRETGHFTQLHLQRVLAAALVLAATIERAEVTQQLRRFQQFMLAGQLSASLIHEVNNRLSNLEMGLRNLQFDLGKSKPNVEAQAEIALASLLGKVDRLVTMTEEVTKTARLFQRLIKADRWEQIDLGELLESARQNLVQQAYHAGVYVGVEHDAALPLIVSSEARLQQVFLNLMLNAIQQGGKGTQLIVRTSHAPEDVERPIKIRFHDTGPGIHRRLFEKVFEFGFTTREDGNGLGLYISRGLIESLGGRMYVESSYVLIGTTLLVELPLRAPDREDGGE